jgi:hypothetical protein
MYASLLEYIGFVGSTFLFLLPLLAMGAPGRLVPACLYSALTAILSYFVFTRLLQTPLPRGILHF